MILLGTQSAQNIITSWVLKDIIQVTKMYAGHFWPFSLGNGYFEGQNNMTRRALFAHVLKPIKTVPECESWRVGLLDCLLRARADLEKQQSDTKRVTVLISSLCTT